MEGLDLVVPKIHSYPHSGLLMGSNVGYGYLATVGSSCANVP